MKKVLALVLVALMMLALFACGKKEDVKPVEYQPIDPADAVSHKDFTSVYSKIGSKVTIDMVEEDKETGLAYVTVDGTKYELGMDFLSMARHPPMFTTNGGSSTFRDGTTSFPKFRFIPTSTSIFTTRRFRTSLQLLIGVPRTLSFLAHSRKVWQALSFSAALQIFPVLSVMPHSVSPAPAHPTLIYRSSPPVMTQLCPIQMAYSTGIWVLSQRFPLPL